jgi:hypothetical protein
MADWSIRGRHDPDGTARGVCAARAAAEEVDGDLMGVLERAVTPRETPLPRRRRCCPF